MISNIFSTCCNADITQDQSERFQHSSYSPNYMAGLFKNIAKPFKESQVSSYTQKLSIAKKLKQKKIRNSFQNNQPHLLMRDFQRAQEKNSNQNDSTRFQQEETSLFTGLFTRQDSKKSLYQELISPRTLIESQVLHPKDLY